MSALFPKFTHRAFHTMVIFSLFFKKYSCDIVTIGIYYSPSSNIMLEEHLWSFPLELAHILMLLDVILSVWKNKK